jgi:hypothetical protein
MLPVAVGPCVVSLMAGLVLVWYAPATNRTPADADVDMGGVELNGLAQVGRVVLAYKLITCHRLLQ